MRFEKRRVDKVNSKKHNLVVTVFRRTLQLIVHNFEKRK